MTSIVVQIAKMPRSGFKPAKANSNTAKLSGRDKEFLAIVALLMAIAVLVINMVLPAFDEISQQFGLSGTSRVGLTVSLLYLGLALGQVTLGPISDIFGRKTALTIGISVFLFECLISGLASSFEVLIFGQVIQGIGLGAPRVITLAILRDRFSGDAMAQAMSFVMFMFVLAPTVAPYIGQTIVAAAGWKSLFVTYSVFGFGLMLMVLYRLPETLPVEHRRLFNLRSIWMSYRSVAINLPAMGYAISLGVVSGPFISYLNMSQQIFEFQYELGEAYPIIFAILSLWIGAASFVNGLIVKKLGIARLVSLALLSIVLASLAALAVGAILKVDIALPAFVIYMGVVLFCFGLLVSNLNAMAMADLAETAGAGSAFVGALTTVISVPVAILIGQFTIGNIMQLQIGFAVCGGISLSIHFLIRSIRQ